jgi:hypothetical protein
LPGMGIWNISTPILIVFDALGVWLLLRPSDLTDLWTARRAPASDVDRFFARLVGVILLSIQIANWSGHAKNTGAEPIMHWLSTVMGVGIVAFLGYQFVTLLKSRPDRRAQVEVADRRFLLPESEEEARARYRAAWQKYRRLRIAFPLLILAWLPFGVVLSALFRLFHWDWHISIIITLACIPFMPILGWQWSFWQCPRCGYAFKGKYDLFFPKRCHHCNLPMWAESPNQ